MRIHERQQKFKAKEQRRHGERLAVVNPCFTLLGSQWKLLYWFCRDVSYVFFLDNVALCHCKLGNRTLKLNIRNSGDREKSGQEQVMGFCSRDGRYNRALDHSWNASKNCGNLRASLASIKLSSCFTMALNRASVIAIEGKVLPFSTLLRKLQLILDSKELCHSFCTTEISLGFLFCVKTAMRKKPRYKRNELKMQFSETVELLLVFVCQNFLLK